MATAEAVNTNSADRSGYREFIHKITFLDLATKKGASLPDGTSQEGSYFKT